MIVANFTDVHHPGTFGWNKLDFDTTGWPEVQALSNSTSSDPTSSNPTGTGTGVSPTSTGESRASRLFNPFARFFQLLHTVLKLISALV